MKPVNRYISLLFIGGLMLPLCDTRTYNNAGKKNNVPICREKVQSVNTSDCETDEGAFSFFIDVLSNITPALKNLK